METGFFGIPGKVAYGKVHAVDDMRMPLCRWKPRQSHEFQFCANGLNINLIECERCKKAIKSHT